MRDQRALIVLLLICLLPLYAVNDGFVWKTYTSTLYIAGLAESDNQIWAATSGGLLAFDPVSQDFTVWTNTEGLFTNTLTCIERGAEGELWIGTDAGVIQRYHPVSGTWDRIEDYVSHSITSLTLYGDSLFVGLDIGISLYRISKQEVKETYRHLGADFQVELPVEDILIEDNTLWAATEEGIAMARLDNVNLLDPECWLNFTSADGLPANEVTSLAFLGTVYAGTPGGTARLIDSTWTALDQFEVRDLIIHENHCFQLNTIGVFKLENDTWIKIGSAIEGGTVLASLSNTLWIGSYGLETYSPPYQDWVQHVPSSPASHIISGLAVDNDSGIWVCSRDGGFFHYDGSAWEVYDRDRLANNSNDFVAAAVDVNNNKWLGSWGGGLVSVQDDSIFTYNAGNGYLSGITADPAYVVVNDIKGDPSGNVWILNREALNNQPLAVITAAGEWFYYGLSDGLNTNLVRVLQIDVMGRKWIGTDNYGIYVLDDNGTPHLKSDDPPILRITTSQGLLSNTITALAGDREGGMWIGSPKGLNYFYMGNIEPRYGIPSDNVVSLAIDGAGNLWAGLDVGISVFSKSSFQWDHYTSESSPLVHNEISCIGVDLNTGTVYLGTSRGISGIKTPYSLPEAELQPLLLFPNPFIPAEHPSLTIDDLAENVSVFIYHPTGRLIRTFDESDVFGKQVAWNGNDNTGRKCASGIYLVVAVRENGDRSVAKLAVIR